MLPLLLLLNLVPAVSACFPCDFMLDAPKYVILPDMSGQTHIVDQSTLVINVSVGSDTVLRGYNAWSHSELIINGSSLDALVSNIDTPPAVSASWDIEGAIQDLETGIFHGLVHREHGWFWNGTYKYYGTTSPITTCACSQSFISRVDRPCRIRDVLPQR